MRGSAGRIWTQFATTLILCGNTNKAWATGHRTKYKGKVSVLLRGGMGGGSQVDG